MAADTSRPAGGARAAPPPSGEASGLPAVVATRGDVLVMVDARGFPYTIHNTPYNRLRYMDYAGQRIMYAFDDDNVIEETYTPGIFNCRSLGRLVQISDTAAVTTTIVEQDVGAYVALCKTWLDSTIQAEYIATYVKGSARLSYDDAAKRYVVDGGMFRVDKNGNAEAMVHDADGRAAGWNSLCIVNTQAREKLEVIDPQLGRITISEKTQMVVGKLMFLLHPSNDRVFLDQLDPTAKAHAKRLIYAGPPESTYDMPRYDDIRGGGQVPSEGGGPLAGLSRVRRQEHGGGQVPSEGGGPQ